MRARVKSHLQALAARFEPLAEAEVIESDGSDYRYRIVVDRQAWALVAKQLAEDIDYSNFKSECARKNQWTDGAYLSALHEVWRIHYRLQSKGDDGGKP
ncbi:MAG: hypothetical protein KF696_10650 [Planctomycetes bacterium]|nr:hypothetical protein [Planctomycetota bacterium]MCW8135111.1 hypothetical protein [Planctomycetota bacterium]